MARSCLAVGTAFLLFVAPCHAGEASEAADTDLSMPAPLTDTPGNPSRGRIIVSNAANASCLICHAMPIPEEPDHGTLGPPLDGVADRLSEGELRQRLVDPKRLNPDTLMPAYYSTDGLYGVDTPYRGRTIYTAQEIEDVVAYLMTLRAQ